MYVIRQLVFALALWFLAAMSVAQVLGTPVITVDPRLPSNVDFVRINVPVPACLQSSDSAHVDSSSWEISGQTIFIAAEQWGLICFSAGDPAVYKPYPIEVGRLSAGTHSVVYYHTWTGQAATQQVLQFEVLARIPALSFPTLIVAAIMLAVAAIVQLRSGA
jgi:hypothetical protein